MRKEWAEKLEAWKMRRKNYSLKFKERLTGVTTMRQCLEKSTNRERTKEEKRWSVKRRQ